LRGASRIGRRRDRTLEPGVPAVAKRTAAVDNGRRDACGRDPVLPRGQYHRSRWPQSRAGAAGTPQAPGETLNTEPRRLKTLGYLMDESIRLPGGYRIGWDG